MEIISLAPGGLCCCVVALGMNCGSFQQIIKILNLSPPPIQMGSDRLLMCNSFQVISLLFSRNITGTSNHLNKRDLDLYVFVSFGLLPATSKKKVNLSHLKCLQLPLTILYRTLVVIF